MADLGDPSGGSDGPARSRWRAELVAVGSELLEGDGVDTNSAWIAARLAEIGVDVERHTIVGDDVDRIAAAVGEACTRAAAVVVTGGLGPTQDDLTRVSVARMAGVGLERHDGLVRHVTEYFERRGRVMPSRNLGQAELPVGALALEPVGTAAGFALEVGGAVVYCVPGVPSEMRTMVERDLLPDLARRAGLGTTVSRSVRTGGMSESAVADACAPVVERLDAAGNPTIAFLAARGETRVRVTARADSRPAALALLEPVVADIVERLGAGVVGVDDEGVEHAIARQLHRLGWTLAVAESITGGGVGARLVTVAGASDWFRGGLIAYSTDAKVTLGDVDPGVLAAHGPVSEATAAALAAGVRQRLGADVGLAVVGVAGPAGHGGQDVGTVAVGAVLPGASPRSRGLRLPGGDRRDIQAFAASAALDFLRRRLSETAG